MAEQLRLFGEHQDLDIETKPIVHTDTSGSIQAAFERFHEANPHVYRALRAVALWCVRHDKKVGMKAIFERVRWEFMIRTRGDGYRLNNNYSSRYARLLMENEPELTGFFETRQLRTR